MELCEKIDNRTKEGKKVLIHCQQGASRSASLIIAYGLYQRPELSVNDAYYAAQAKSRWISPNMKLMYSLQDFQKDLAKKRTPSSAFRPRTGRSPTKHRLTLSADAIDLPQNQPHTAPLPGEDRPREGEPNKSPRTSGRPRGSSSTRTQDISPGPASAPLNFSWKRPLEQDSLLQPLQPAFASQLDSLPQRPKSGMGRTEPSSFNFEAWSKPSPSPSSLPKSQAGFGFQSLPFHRFQGIPSNEPPIEEAPVERVIDIPSTYPSDDMLLSPRIEAMAGNPFRDFASSMAGMSFIKSPPTPTEGLFSPRENMFPRDPFSVFARPAPIADPRSPPIKGDPAIIRSIDDML